MRTRCRPVRAALVRRRSGAFRPARAFAQSSYPNKPIRLLVGTAAGGPGDIAGRIAAASMSEVLGQQIVIENRTGASGNLATQYVARAEPDGYTLLLANNSTAVNESMFKNFEFTADKYFTPVAGFDETGLVLVVHPSLEVRSVTDLIALAKSKPGELLYASAGKGTGTHLAAELFNMMTGVKMNPVHYRGGGETIKDLLSGEVKIMFSSIPPVLGLVKDGRLRGIATSQTKRDPLIARPADHRRFRRARFRRAHLARPVRAEGHAARGHREAVGRGQEGKRIRRDEEGARCTGL